LQQRRLLSFLYNFSTSSIFRTIILIGILPDLISKITPHSRHLSQFMDGYCAFNSRKYLDKRYRQNQHQKRILCFLLGICSRFTHLIHSRMILYAMLFLGVLLYYFYAKSNQLAFSKNWYLYFL
jgi:hypothetical protein